MSLLTANDAVERGDQSAPCRIEVCAIAEIELGENAAIHLLSSCTRAARHGAMRSASAGSDCNAGGDYQGKRQDARKTPANRVHNIVHFCGLSTNGDRGERSM
ncbi:hypothetical protein XAUB_11750 [Xanthomonas citri pv. aurantifolii str. ICPB 11122]|nr:hypothetical protein XAUB_11750 [Xanthomonas citri pv. aurantifolii str. ICPB 11122]